MKEKSEPLSYMDDPKLSTGTKEFLKELNADPTPVESLSITDARNVLVNAQKSVPVDVSGIDESEKNIVYNDRPLKLNIVRPKGVTDKLPVFLFIHGGGWVLGDYPTHRRLVRDLVVESGLAAVFVNYTPSPEAKYPQPLEEIYAAAEWLSRNGDEINVDGSKMAIVGNSVGGNMAVATALKAKEQNNTPEIKCLVLLWPVTDAGTEWKSWRKFGKERFLTSSLMEWMWDQYTTDQNERDGKYASPLWASLDELGGLPPTLIEVAQNDILRDQAEALGRKLDLAGVEATTVRFNGVIHDWGMLNGYARLPQTRDMIVFSAAMLKKHLR